MDNPPDMLDFVKAASDTDRLRVIGILAQGSVSIKAVALELNIPFRRAFNHLAYLGYVGVVRKAGDVFILNEGALESFSRKQFSGSRATYVPAPDQDPKTRKVLAAHLNPDGSIRQIPFQPAKLRIILNYLLPAFTPGIDYTEKEVNAILRRFHADTAGLRRDLVETGMLSRESDGSRYWRSPAPAEGQPS
jgi:hypothetical protein